MEEDLGPSAKSRAPNFQFTIVPKYCSESLIQSAKFNCIAEFHLLTECNHFLSTQYIKLSYLHGIVSWSTHFTQQRVIKGLKMLEAIFTLQNLVDKKWQYSINTLLDR